MATEVFLPGRKINEVSSYKGLRMWISDDTQLSYIKRPPLLYLLGDFRQADSDEYFVMSGMSIITILLQKGNVDCEENIVIKNADEDKLHIRQPHGLSLSLDPVRLLSKLGAEIRTTRRIEVVYRVRHIFQDYFRKYEASVFAYPLLVSEA